jgi:hypothetical protein
MLQKNARKKWGKKQKIGHEIYPRLMRESL